MGYKIQNYLVKYFYPIINFKLCSNMNIYLQSFEIGEERKFSGLVYHWTYI